MHLSRLAAALLTVVTLTACQDSIGPKLRSYALTAIDEHPLPVTFMGIDAGSTVLSGKLYLDNVGHALRINRVRDYWANFGGGTQDRTERLQNAYMVANDSIKVGSFDPCTSFCPTNEVGVFSDSMLTLTVDAVPHNRPVYTYRRVKGSAIDLLR